MGATLTTLPTGPVAEPFATRPRVMAMAHACSIHQCNVWKGKSTTAREFATTPETLVFTSAQIAQKWVVLTPASTRPIQIAAEQSIAQSNT
jgi:hypothetical protein